MEAVCSTETAVDFWTDYTAFYPNSNKWVPHFHRGYLYALVFEAVDGSSAFPWSFN
jgi:hypothetical protein